MTQTQQPAAGAQTTPFDGDTGAAEAPREGANAFVWHDLMSTDPDRAVAFYTALLGWTTTGMSMGEGMAYTMIHAGGRGIGGIVPLDPSHGIPSHWIGYLAVENVDRAAEESARLGGTVCVPPTDIPNVGRFAVVEDSTGALFSPFTPLPGQEAPEADGPPPAGIFCWNELLTTDPDGASRFYAGLVGWSYERSEMGEHGSYWIARSGGAMVTGMMRLPEPAREAGARSYWLPYVLVGAVDAAAARAEELGGRVLVQPADVPGMGRFAVIEDPCGAHFALFSEAAAA